MPSVTATSPSTTEATGVRASIGGSATNAASAPTPIPTQATCRIATVCGIRSAIAVMPALPP